tara:strand:- start:471 stop:722 length:252 start_codon:yes stop_codon:yes gene_type:complete
MEYDMRKDCQIQVFKEGGKWLTEDEDFLFVLHKTEDETETVIDYDDFLEGQTTKCPKVFFLYQRKISSGALYEADENEMTILF